jgi:hypothetical protein
MMDVLSVNNVYYDLYHYNQNGAYGVIGLGPLSPLWQAYTDPNNLQATFSIALGRN